MRTEEIKRNDQRFQNIGIIINRDYKKCGLTKLDKRRRREDLIEANKLVTNKEAIPFSTFLQLANRRLSGLREHRYRILRKSEGTFKQRLFCSRVVKD